MVGNPRIEIGDNLATGAAARRKRDLPCNWLKLNAGNIDTSCEYSLRGSRHISFLERAWTAHLGFIGDFGAIPQHPSVAYNFPTGLYFRVAAQRSARVVKAMRGEAISAIISRVLELFGEVLRF
jgi:hypothetical protein